MQKGEGGHIEYEIPIVAFPTCIHIHIRYMSKPILLDTSPICIYKVSEPFFQKKKIVYF